MAHKTARGTIDVSKSKDVNLLHSKAVGLAGVLFLAVTGAAPMSAMLGNVPFAAGYGIGIYTPAAFLLATIVLTIFSIGYAAMASRVSSVGGFYSFISQGLGREVGMSAGISIAGLLLGLRGLAHRPVRLLRQLVDFPAFGRQRAVDRPCPCS